MGARLTHQWELRDVAILVSDINIAYELGGGFLAFLQSFYSLGKSSVGRLEKCLFPAIYASLSGNLASRKCDLGIAKSNPDTPIRRR